MKTLPPFFKHLTFFSEALPNDAQLVDDDIKREEAFKNQALQACLKAQKMILSAGMNFFKPSTIHGSTLKTVEQLTRIQDKMDLAAKESKKIEEMRKQRSMKKVAKKIQTEKVQAREHSRKEAAKMIVGSHKGNREFGVSVEDSSAKKNDPKKHQSVSKRSSKDKKYGFGGKKRGTKRNTKASCNDDSIDFKASLNKKPARRFNGKSRQ
jgi:rRNA-processing protein EBP2